MISSCVHFYYLLFDAWITVPDEPAKFQNEA